MATGNKSGFTLIELIAALVLLGILAAGMGRGIAIGVSIYATARENIVITQKAQVALTRMAREFKELTHIAAVGDSPWIIYDKLDGRHAIAAAADTVKLYNLSADQAALSPADLALHGHVLVDRIAGLSLSYRAGNLSGQPNGSSTWTPTDDLANLSAIEIQLNFARLSDPSQNLPFKTLVHPRNINSHGGTVPSSGPHPPTRSNYCFIQAAAANVSAQKGCRNTLLVLLIPIIVGISALCPISSPTGKSAGKGCNDRGAVLIWIVVSLTLFSALAATILSMTSAFRIGQVAGAFSDQAGLLAESGYRFAAGTYLNAATEVDKNNALLELHDQTYHLADNSGRFTLRLYPYFFYTTAANSDNTIAVAIPGGIAENLANHIDALAWVGIGAQIYSCRPAWPSGGTAGTLSLNENIPTFEAGTTVLMAARSADYPQNITAENHYLYFEGNSGDVFPDRNAEIIFNHHVYTYHQNDRAANRLVGLTDPAGGEVVSVPAGSDILLHKYVNLETVGSAGSGTLQTERKLIYHTPLPMTAPIEEHEEWHDAFDDMEHWKAQWGSYQIESIDNNNVLRITGISNPKNYGKAGLAALDWSTTPFDLQDFRAGSNGYLSYTAQVKIGFDATVPLPDWGYDPDPPLPKYYSAGLVFRLDGNQNCYGLSLLRGNDDQAFPYDNLDDNLVPQNNAHLIVLWQATEEGTNRRWLAYKRLDSFYDDMENGSFNWSMEFPWGIIDNIYNLYTLPSPSPSHPHNHSPRRSLHNIELGHYRNNMDISAQTRTITIGSPCNVVLKFSHFYDIAAGDRGFVELSHDGGQNWEENPIHTIFPGKSQRWEAVTIDLGSFPTSTDIRVRFRLQSDQAITADGWFVDDVALITLPVPLSTLAVRISEAATVGFTSGGPTEIEMDSVVSSTSGVGRVVEPPLLSSADWQGGDAAGILRLEMISGEFVAGQTLSVGTGVDAATIQNFRARENLIRAYYGSNTPCGSGDQNRFNLNRSANRRLTDGTAQTGLNWPPEPHEEWTAEADRFIQIQWDEINTAVVQPDGSAAMVDSIATQEPDGVIRSWENALVIAADSPLDAGERPEIGLHGFGHGARNIFFDDFGLRSTIRVGGTTPVAPLME